MHHAWGASRRTWIPAFAGMTTGGLGMTGGGRRACPCESGGMTGGGRRACPCEGGGTAAGACPRASGGMTGGGEAVGVGRARRGAGEPSFPHHSPFPHLPRHYSPLPHLPRHSRESGNPETRRSELRGLQTDTLPSHRQPGTTRPARNNPRGIYRNADETPVHPVRIVRGAVPGAAVHPPPGLPPVQGGGVQVGPSRPGGGSGGPRSTPLPASPLSRGEGFEWASLCEGVEYWWLLPGRGGRAGGQAR